MANITYRTLPFKTRKLSQWLAVWGMFLPLRYQMIMIALNLFIIMPHRRFKVYHINTILYTLLALLFSMAVSAVIGYDYSKGIQQSFVILFCLFGYLQILSYNDYEVMEIFRKYIKVVFTIAVIGIIQEITYVLTNVDFIDVIYKAIGLKTGHNTQPIGGTRFLRITSVMTEGGNYGMSLIPSMIYLHYYNDKYKILFPWKKWLITFVGFLTVSPFFYISIAIILFLKVTKRFRIIRIAGIILVIFSIPSYMLLQEQKGYDDSAAGIDAINMKISDTYNSLNDVGNINAIGDYNISTGVLLANTYVALHAPSRILGTGIGTNAQSYESLIGVYYSSSNDSFEGLNADDSYSLLLRIGSEFGLLGVFLFILMLVKFFNINSIVNVSLSSFLFCLFFRGGGYADWGIIMILLIMYLTSKMNKDKTW